MRTVTRFEGGFAMDRGAVAILDALGFRGAWRENPLKVATNLQWIRDRLGEFLAARLSLDEDLAETWVETIAPLLFDMIVPSVQFFSDTILLSCRLTFPTVIEDLQGCGVAELLDMCDLLCVEIVAEMAALCYFLGAACEEPILYRGAISAGEFSIHDSITIGPAVDEAADLMDEPQAALIWLAPSAERIFLGRNDLLDYLRNLREQFPETLGLIEPPESFCLVQGYPVQLKTGSWLHSTIVDVLAPSRGETGQVLAAVNRKMCLDGVDVRLKRQNTIRMLQDLGRLERGGTGWLK